ncbi:ATP-binding cassette domain-containing protein [Craterilacuibacter sp.]|uniref:ATP-binding cassette domain-containing protein n=1 Tax=Craterilacuibacter sp. TaxID=2870909 RepID=UPI003F3FF400
MLELNALTLTLPDGRLIGPVSCNIASGEILTLMGPSGCGKSSILAALAGTLPPAIRLSGQLHLAGRALNSMPIEQRRIGLLFQDALLFPHMSVAENLAFALPAAVRGRARKDAVIQALQQAELAGLGARSPVTLSGGQAARVALMRALLAEPAALLLDEPFSRLDTRLRADMRDFVYRHLRARAIPALLVTHDSSDVPAGGRIIQLELPDAR